MMRGTHGVLHPLLVAATLKMLMIRLAHKQKKVDVDFVYGVFGAPSFGQALWADVRDFRALSDITWLSFGSRQEAYT